MKLTLPRGSALFGAGTVTLVVASVLVIRAGEARRVDRSLAALSLVASLQSSSALEEMEEARSDAILWSSFGGMIQRLVDLEDAWAVMGPDARSVLERIYVSQNPFPEAERSLLTDPGDGSRYSEIHAEFQPRVRAFLGIHGYQDVLLVNSSGRVVYSFGKEADFGADLLGGPWRETRLAEIAGAAALGPGTTVIADFEPYEALRGEWALFIGAPVQGVGAGGEEGALVFQLTPEHIGKHLARGEQQRKSAASMILGDGYRILGAPPWMEEDDAENPLAAEARERARGAGSGSMILRDRSGAQVLAAWEAVTFEGIRWIVVAQVDMDEVRAEGASARRTMEVVAFLLWLSLGVLTLGLQRASALGRHRI